MCALFVSRQLTLLAVWVLAKLLNGLGEGFQEEVKQLLLQWRCALLNVTLLAFYNCIKGSGGGGRFEKKITVFDGL